MRPASASLSSFKASVVQPKRKLHQPWIIVLAADKTECGAALYVTGGAELHTIEDIKKLTAELQAKAFADLRVLEQSEIIIGDSGKAQVRIGAALASEAILRWRRETSGIEPFVDTRLRRTLDRFFATRDDIRARRSTAQIRAQHCR